MTLDEMQRVAVLIVEIDDLPCGGLDRLAREFPDHDWGQLGPFYNYNGAEKLFWCGWDDSIPKDHPDNCSWDSEWLGWDAPKRGTLG